MDARTHRLLTEIQQDTYGLRPGSPQMEERRQVLLAHLDAVRPFIPRRDVLELERVLDANTLPPRRREVER